MLESLLAKTSYIIDVTTTMVGRVKFFYKNRFSIKTAPYVRSQIARDLGYFRHPTSLIKQAIASIRKISDAK